MRLGDLTARLTPRRRRRRRAAPRPGAPTTILPLLDELERAVPAPDMAARLDAARERLRRETPPRDED